AYHPGDVVRYRSLTLERFHLKPAEEDLHLRFRLSHPGGPELYRRDVSSHAVAGLDGKPLTGPDAAPVRGVGSGEFRLPNELPDGTYTLSVAEVNDRFTEEKRTVLVQRRPPPGRYRKELSFDRDTYAPGDRVRVKFKAEPVTPPGPAAG